MKRRLDIVLARYVFIFLDLAENVSTAYTRLEISVRTIETQTRLIRAQTIDRIRRALLAGDDASARVILRDCAAALPRPEDPLIAGLLAGMLKSILLELRVENEALVSPGEIPDYIPGSQDDVFGEQFPASFSRIAEGVRSHGESVPSLGRDVVAYINEHLYDPALYITMASDHFGISAPTLQKLVRRCTGQTFLNYVENCRLAKACRLLSGTHGSIAHIAEECGFASAVTFSRSFKRVYGFPPSRLQDTRGV